jgi:hypothetical protein
VQAAGAAEVALSAHDEGKVVEALSGVEIIGAQVHLTNREGPLEQTAGLGMVGALP